MKAAKDYPNKLNYIKFYQAFPSKRILSLALHEGPIRRFDDLLDCQSKAAHPIVLLKIDVEGEPG